MTDNVDSGDISFMPPIRFPIRFRASSVATFTLIPSGDGTKVTWSMDGPNPLMSKFIGLVMNMDKLVGEQFEQGLATLKAMVETGAKAPAA